MVNEKYNEGKIYKIVNNANDIIYIGSTIQSLNQRMIGHKSSSKSTLGTSPIYDAMRKIGARRFRIVLIKNFPCRSKEELVKEEYKIMQEYKRSGKELYNVCVKQINKIIEPKKIIKSRRTPEEQVIYELNAINYD